MPCGRRVSVESLQNKVLAVDASIWLTQFVKAMRDDEGKMIPNAHLIGTFRRVVKLLMNGIRPVFVFDGGTPELKRNTLIARKQRRSDESQNVTRTAQKLLINTLKQLALKQAETSLVSNATNDDNGGALAPGFNPGPSGPQQPSTGGSTGEIAVSEKDDKINKNASQGAISVKVNGHGEGVSETVHRRQRSNVRKPRRSSLRKVRTRKAKALEDVQGKVSRVAHPYVSEEKVNRSGMIIDVDANDDEWEAMSVEPEEEEEEGSEEDAGFELPDEVEDIDDEALANLPPSDQRKIVEELKRRQRTSNRRAFLPLAGELLVAGIASPPQLRVNFESLPPGKPLDYSKTQLSNFLRSSKLNQRVARVNKKSGQVLCMCAYQV